MNAFVNEVNHRWEKTDAVVLAAYVLWKLNFIHPFINGNGRTARALCYFVICVKSGGLLKGDSSLPELIRQNRDKYIKLLKETDKLHNNDNSEYLKPMHSFIVRLVDEQLQSASLDEH